MNHSSDIIVTVYCIANVFNKIEYVIHNEVLKMKAGKLYQFAYLQMNRQNWKQCKKKPILANLRL